MNCCVCQVEIKPKDKKAWSIIRMAKLYGCWNCNQSGAFDQKIDELALLAEAERQDETE